MTRTILSLCALATLAGCGTLLDEGPSNRCASDDDCPTGRCAIDVSMCVTDPPAPLRVGVEVLPAAVAGGATTLVSFPAFDLHGTMDQDFVLPAGVRATGLVHDTSSGDPVTADVTFALRSQFEGGQTVRISAQTRLEVSADAEGRAYNLSARLLPGSTYEVTVTPNGDWASRRPPIRVASSYLSPSGTAETYLDFLSYPDLCPPSALAAPTAEDDCLVEVRGTIVDAAGAPQDGMVVRIVDKTSGQLLSSTYTTGADPDALPGTFRVVVHLRRWMDSGNWLFSFTPGALRIEESGPAPTFTVDPATLLQDEAGWVTILTPAVQSVVSYAGWVESEATSTGLAGAMLSFTSSDVADSSTGVVGRFSTSTTTADDGQFEVRLLPGTYDVVITPDPASDLGILRQQRVIGASATTLNGQLFEVPTRTSFAGTVHTQDGLGVADARVRARPRGIDWMGMLGPISALARSSDTLTDQDGRFGVSLDVGVFDVVVEPPAGSNYPWRVLPDLPNGGSGTSLIRDFELTTPVSVTGTASFDDGTPAAGAELRAYAIVESTDTTTRAIQIGRAQADADGVFTLLLPPSL